MSFPEIIMKQDRISSISIILLLMLFVSPAYAGGLTTAVNARSNASHARINLTAVQVSSSLVLPDTVPYCQHGNLICYTPQDIRKAYNYPSNLDGSGQTIVIVDAFGSPSVANDLNTFNQLFGLPFSSFTVVCPAEGCPTLDLSGTNDLSNREIGWTQEIALDTQWAHAMAPAANIVLAVSSSDDNFAINAAIRNAVNQYPGSILSQSFGTPEGTLNLTQGSADLTYLIQAERLYKQAAEDGITVFASAGDWGADFSAAVPGLNFANAGYPASSPFVTGVGGTQGNPYFYGSAKAIPLCHTSHCTTGLVNFDNRTGTCTRYTSSLHSPFCTPTGYGGEQVWNEPQFAAATGGAPSIVFATPSYQSGLDLPSRTTPDVSYDAAISGGVLAVWTPIPDLAGVYVFGGTSAGSPQWAGIAALANQLDQKQNGQHLGFINQALYQIGHDRRSYQRDFHDITKGNNLVAGGTVGFSAHKGYDDASGWGTPSVANLISDLVQASQTNSNN